MFLYFTDWCPNVELRSTIGYAYLAFIILAVAINMCIVLVDMVSQVKLISIKNYRLLKLKYKVIMARTNKSNNDQPVGSALTEETENTKAKPAKKKKKTKK